MISNKIDGSSGGTTSQLFELLTVVANPDMYKERLADLEAKTAEYKLYVEAVAPASEILAMRDKVELDVASLKAEAEKDREQAVKLVESAKQTASETLAKANRSADQLAAETKATLSEARKAKGEAEKLKSGLAEAVSAAEAARAAADSESAETVKVRAQLEADRQEVAQLRKQLVAKHRAFIEGL